MRKENAQRRHPQVYAYQSMLQRCYNPNNPQYKDYGGRGVTICERWQSGKDGQGFTNFTRDMGIKPKDALLDRIDNDKGYSPDNCKWSTRKEQQRNRRNNIFITYQGKTQCAKDWSIELGVNNITLLRRYKLGLPLEIVFSKANFRGKAF
jgi:hypothetical protein